MRISDWSSDVCSSDLGPLSKWLWTRGGGGKPGHRQQRRLNAGGHPKRGKVKSRKLKTGLLWHSGQSVHLGVGALTMANMAIARQIAEEHGCEQASTIIGEADTGGRWDERRLGEVGA